MPGDPTRALASMGNYVFTRAVDTEFLIDAVTRDAASEGSEHDVGGDIIPLLVDDGSAHVYDFTGQVIPGQSEAVEDRLLRAGYDLDLDEPEMPADAWVDVSAATGAMWERSIPTITPAWTWSLLCPSSTCTTTVGPILAWHTAEETDPELVNDQ